MGGVETEHAGDAAISVAGGAEVLQPATRYRLSADPKALLFFTALLPQFIDPRQGIASQMVLLAVTSIVIEFIVLGMYGYLAARIANLARSDRFVRSTNLVSGGLLVLAGAGLALARRQP